MTIEDVIKKSILPLAFMVFWFWMTKTIMKVSGQTDWFWWVFIAGLPFGIHKMRLILIPRGMDTTATLGMAALSVIIGVLIGSIMIAKFVLAVRRNYSDEVSFIPVKAFAKKAEFARDYLMQGTKVMVEGEIVTGNYEDKDTGKKIYTTEVYANRIEFAGAKMVDRLPFPEDAEGFLEIPEGMEEEMPFR